MEKIRDVAVLVGSLRKASLNRKVAHALIEVAPLSLKLDIVEIGQLLLYNPDEEENAPDAWKQFRERICAADAVLFVTPEHNRSVPAALKNAMAKMSGAASQEPSSAHRQVLSEASGPTIICASHWCSSMFPPRRSRRSTSAAPTNCSMMSASFPMREHANSCRASCKPLPRGLRQMRPNRPLLQDRGAGLF